VHVAIDATPLIGRPTGVGRYVRGLVDAVPGLPDPPVLDAVTLSVRRGPSGLVLPEGTHRRGVRVPAALWRRTARHPTALVDRALGRPDVWHATNFVAPVPRHAALVVGVHDLAYLLLPGTVQPAARRLRELVPQVLRHASAVATISRAGAEAVQEAYPWLDVPVHVVPLGVDPGWATATPLPAADLAAMGLPEEYVVAVGTREPRKNLGTLVRAHAATGGRAPALVLLGSQGWGEDLDGVEPGADVRRTGWVPDDVLRRLVAGARALAAPSRYEGFGLTVLEGLAAGVPVLASDIAAHREVAAGVATLLPVDDVDAWAEALAATSGAQPDPAAALLRRERAGGYTWHGCALAHVALWRDALAARPARGTARP
jgi:glycosyltransferase involved in cell wall biosynthesis